MGRLRAGGGRPETARPTSAGTANTHLVQTPNRGPEPPADTALRPPPKCVLVVPRCVLVVPRCVLVVPGGQSPYSLTCFPTPTSTNDGGGRTERSPRPSVRPPRTEVARPDALPSVHVLGDRQRFPVGPDVPRPAGWSPSESRPPRPTPPARWRTWAAFKPSANAGGRGALASFEPPAPVEDVDAFEPVEDGPRHDPDRSPLVTFEHVHRNRQYAELRTLAGRGARGPFRPSTSSETAGASRLARTFRRRPVQDFEHVARPIRGRPGAGLRRWTDSRPCDRGERRCPWCRPWTPRDRHRPGAGRGPGCPTWYMAGRGPRDDRPRRENPHVGPDLRARGAGGGCGPDRSPGRPLPPLIPPTAGRLPAVELHGGETRPANTSKPSQRPASASRTSAPLPFEDPPVAPTRSRR